MELTNDFQHRTDEIAALFRSSFTDSEGRGEGALIGALAANMMATVSDDDLHVFLAVEQDVVVAAIMFSRLSYPEDTRTVFLLAPVAVATGHQGKGVGQTLIQHGLDHLKAQGVDVAITYGDINFYSRVGFAPITEAQAQAPLPLQYPEGWLGQALSSATLAPLKGPSHCVDALNSPDYW